MLKKLDEEADESAPDVHEEVNQKKPIDEELANNLYLLVGIEVQYWSSLFSTIWDCLHCMEAVGLRWQTRGGE